MVMTMTMDTKNNDNNPNAYNPQRKQRETTCNGAIKPTLMYGRMVWDSCCAESLRGLKKRAVRIILDADMKHPTGDGVLRYMVGIGSSF